MQTAVEVIDIKLVIVIPGFVMDHALIYQSKRVVPYEQEGMARKEKKQERRQAGFLPLPISFHYLARQLRSDKSELGLTHLY